MEYYLEGTSIIGQQRGSAHQPILHGINPVTKEVNEPRYSPATAQEIDQALTLAEDASSKYGALPPDQKAAFLNTIASELEGIIEQIATLGPLETGLPEARMRGETARTCGQLRMFAELVADGSWVNARIDHALPDRAPVAKPDLRCMLRPLGPVAVFCASNFPLAFSVAGGDTASALAAGCPVIVKAHRSHPVLAELAGQCIQKAAKKTGMPDGVFSLLYGPQSLGSTLVSSPTIQAVGFTGSQAGGSALMQLAATRPQPIPVYAEMSSINPVLILPDALAEKSESLAEGLFSSLTMGGGQFCTNPGLIFLPDSGGEILIEKLSSLIHASSGSPMLNAGTAQAYQERLNGLKNTVGVTQIACTSGEGAPALFQVSQLDFAQAASLQEECFGPATLIVTGPLEKLPHLISQLEGQLTGTLHASEDEIARHQEVISALEKKVGRLIFNGFPTGVEVCPAMVHGGPYPATSDGRSSSVGTLAIERFARAVSWQDFPDQSLPLELQESNPLKLKRLVDGKTAL